ncbi:MAG: bifunctional 4-hydroxy-2-oxoglutarate aldolase/2-dehydro-3-deoxy-phosphogluconate aldolase [Eubacteriales bacterium]
MNEIFKKIGEHGLVPVIKIEDAANAVPLARALCAGGLPVAEITFRTACAAEAIEAITDALPNMIVGAGTVLTEEQAEAAVKAGAEFIVSPGFNPNVVGWCVENKIPVAPGCATPSDIEAAIEYGLDVVKFFPAEASGGIPMIKAMSAPYSGIHFIPTSGINEANLVEYLKNDCVLACGGSFMVKDEYIKSGEFGKITDLTRAALMNMYGFRLAHIGVNLPDTAAAKKAALLAETMFGFTPKEGKLGIMCDGQLEFMCGPYFGDYGHIAVATNFIERAMAYFCRMGFSFRENGLLYNDEGKINAAYLEGDFFGCAVHLLRKK